MRGVCGVRRRPHGRVRADGEGARRVLLGLEPERRDGRHGAGLARRPVHGVVVVAARAHAARRRAEPRGHHGPRTDADPAGRRRREAVHRRLVRRAGHSWEQAEQRQWMSTRTSPGGFRQKPRNYSVILDVITSF